MSKNIGDFTYIVLDIFSDIKFYLEGIDYLFKQDKQFSETSEIDLDRLISDFIFSLRFYYSAEETIESISSQIEMTCIDHEVSELTTYSLIHMTNMFLMSIFHAMDALGIYVPGERNPYTVTFFSYKVRTWIDIYTPVLEKVDELNMDLIEPINNDYLIIKQ